MEIVVDSNVAGVQGHELLQLLIPHLSPLFLWLRVRPINRQFKRLAEMEVEQWLLNCSREGDAQQPARVYFSIFLSTNWQKRLHQKHVHSHLARGDCMSWIRFKRYNAECGWFEFEDLPNADANSLAAIRLTGKQREEWSTGKHAQLLLTTPLWLPEYNDPDAHSGFDDDWHCIFCRQQQPGDDRAHRKRAISNMPMPVNNGENIFDDYAFNQQSFVVVPKTPTASGNHHPEFQPTSISSDNDGISTEVLADGTVIRNCYDNVLGTPRKRHLPSCRCRRHFHCDTEERIRAEFSTQWPPLRSISFSLRSNSSLQEELMISYHTTALSPPSDPDSVRDPLAITHVPLYSFPSSSSKPVSPQTSNSTVTGTPVTASAVLPSPPPTQARTRRSKRLAAKHSLQTNPSSATQFSSDGVVSDFSSGHEDGGLANSPTTASFNRRRNTRKRLRLGRPGSPYVGIHAESPARSIKQSPFIKMDNDDEGIPAYLLGGLHLQDSSEPTSPSERASFSADVGSAKWGIAKISSNRGSLEGESQAASCKWQLDKLICSPSFLFAPMLVHADPETLEPPPSYRNRMRPARKRWDQMFQLSDIKESDEYESSDDIGNAAMMVDDSLASSDNLPEDPFWEESTSVKPADFSARVAVKQYPPKRGVGFRPSYLFDRRMTSREFEEYLDVQGLSPIDRANSPSQNQSRSRLRPDTPAMPAPPPSPPLSSVAVPHKSLNLLSSPYPQRGLHGKHKQPPIR